MEPSSGLALELLRDCPAGILTLDRAGVVTWANARLLKLVGADRPALVGRDRTGLADGRLAPLLADQARIPLPARAGTRWLRCQRRTFEPPFEGIAEIRYYLDVTPEESCLERDWHRATTDPVTGLLNRRALLLALEPQVARTRRYGSPLALLVTRLTPPDPEEPTRQPEALLAATQILRDRLRWADLVGFDSGRFIAALPETDAAGAAHIARELHDHLRTPPVGASAARTLTDGARSAVTDWRRGDDAAALLERAERALDGASTGEGCAPLGL